MKPSTTVRFEDRQWSAQQQWAAQQQAAPPPPAPPPAPPSSGSSGEAGVIEQLKELGALRDQGILTDEEFAAQKAKILGS